MGKISMFFDIDFIMQFKNMVESKRHCWIICIFPYGIIVLLFTIITFGIIWYGLVHIVFLHNLPHV